MASLPVNQPWSRKTLLVSKVVLEMAVKFKKRVQIELFAPARQCPQCKRLSEVFVHPTRLCAPCWSYFILSKLTRAVKKLAAAA